MTTYANDSILYLSHNDVKLACAQLDTVALIREAFRLHSLKQTALPAEAYLAWTNGQGESVRSLNMPGYLGGNWGVAGTKIINGNILNSTRGLPRASGLTLLYDDTSARISCIMEAAYISSLRTASVSALAVDLLQGANVRCAAVIGAGVLAQAHIELLAKRLPSLREIRLFELQAERCAQIQHALRPLLQASNIELLPVASAEEAIRPAQLIIPATTTTEGYIAFDWLQPGSLLVNISLDDPLPEVVLNAALVVVDDWELVKDDERRLLGRMYRQGQIIGPDDPAPATTISAAGYRRIDAELGDIVTGKKPGRQKADDIILVNPFGLSIEDIALATHVYRVARDLKLGVSLER